MGQPELALDMLKKAIAAAPDLLDAYMHLALVYVRLGRDKEAAATIDEAARRFPQEGASLKQRFQEMKTAAAEAPAPTEGDPHAGIAPPSEGAGGRPSAGGRPGADPAGPGATAGSAGGKRVSGVVELDPALEGSVAPEAFLFVFVRESGFGAGPPVAVRRFASPSFPVRFEISDADAMMGQTFPNELLVEARLDADGDPTTRPPTDPKARLDDVRVGRSDVRLVLKR
jgi:tetratricopeptide (TPR) repeat protein